MDDGSPALEVGFVIDTGGSFDELARLQELMNSTEVKVLAEAAKIERATSGMVNLAGATASISTFSNAATRELQSTAREMTKVEKAGEAMVRQLERQNAAFGKSREELRSVKAETLALAAEQKGLTELAGRLRAEESALYDKEFAAARAARLEAEAAAQDKERAAQLAVAAAAREAQAVREAALAYQLFETRAREGMKALREQQAAQQASTAATAAAQSAAEASALRLRAQIDPLWAAQKRYDTELESHNNLLARGLISEAEHSQAVALSGTALNQARQALDGHSNSLGLNRMQFVIGASAVHRFADSIMAGTPPMRAFMMQAGDLATVLQMDDGGVAGGLAKVRGLITPVTVGIAALAVGVAIGAKAWWDYSEATEKAQALSLGAGRVIGASAEDINAQAQAATNLATISIGAARDIVMGYVQMGGIGKSVLGGLTALSVDFAAATGKDSKVAVEELGRAFQDPVKGAEELTQRYGALTQAQVEHIKDLAEQNDLYGAQSALLKGLEPAFDGAAEHANGLVKAWRWIAAEAADAWNWMGAAIDRAAGGGTLLQKIADLQKQRAAGPVILQRLEGVTTASFQAGIDKQIADLQRQLQQVNNASARSKAVGAMKLVDNIVGEEDVGNLRQRLAVVKGLLADNGKAAGLTAEQVGNARQAYDMLTHAVGTYLPEAEKQVKLAQLDAQIATAKKAHDQGQVASLAAQRSQIENAGKLMTASQAEAQATANGTKAKLEAVKAGDKHAAQLVREAEAAERKIANLYKLAAAYQVSDAAALIAEARVKAESEAITKRADVAAAFDRQVRLEIAQRVSDSQKNAAATNTQAMAQAQVNAQVAAGLVPASQASQLLQDRLAILPLIAAQQAAQEEADKAAAANNAKRQAEFLAAAQEAKKAIDRQTASQQALNKAKAEAQFNSATEAGSDQLAQLQEELRLVGATDAERVRALATLKATQEANRMIAAGLDPEKAKAYATQQVAIADAAQRNTETQRNYNDDLSFTADKWDLIARNVQRAGQGMADAFGAAGRAIGDMASIYANYQADRTRLEEQHKAALKLADKDQAAREKANTKFALASATQQIGAFGDMAAAAKGFFDEKSKGYKALETAEKAFRAIQFAMSVRAMAQDAIETAASIANSIARTAKNAVEAVSKALASLPPPLNFVAAAAVVGALAAIGVSIAGGFGGGKSTLTPANDGTGTVLGDSAAKSDSIKNALDALKEVDLVTNVYSRQMADSLKSIDNQIGGVAAVLVRGGDINANDSVAQGFKPNLIGSVLGSIPLIGGLLSGLFGTRTDVTGSGIYGAPQSVGSILNGGFNAQSYSDVTKTHKFLGIVTGRSYSTQYGSVDPALADQFTLILKQFDTAILAAAGPLGAATSEIQNRLNSFVVNIGKIDLQGLTGTQIQDKLNAIFGAAADDMANAAFPGISQFQKVGEGAFETLVRVSSTVEAVTTALDQMGASAHALSVASKLGLADQFDSLSAFSQAVGSYFSAFYTKEEQAAAQTAQFGKVFASLGLSMPSTLAAFRALVEAQDLTTAAGQATYATLLKLAPAFAELQSSLEGAKSAADIASERTDLQRQLLQLQGDEAALRALDLAKIDPSNRALQQQIWALQDAQAAAKAAQDLADAWKSVGDSIMDEVKRIRGLSGTTGDNSFATLLGQFNAANVAARGGDQTAAKSLPGLSQALLKAAEDAATSRQELQRIQAQTASSLEATYAAITGLGTPSTKITDGTSSSSALLSAASLAQTATTPTAANDDLLTELKGLRSEVAAMRSENTSGLAATAGNTGKIVRKLEDVTAESGGNAISVAGAA